MRVKITTTIEENLLNRAREFGKKNFNSGNGKESINSVIEKALELYFSTMEQSIWEKSLLSGWIKKVVIQRDSVFYENIKNRREVENFKKEDYSKEKMLKRGWKKVDS